MHLGHAYAALNAFRFATADMACCLLRIEDIDHTRARPHFLKAIFQDLTALGFHWPEPVYIQSQHSGTYQNVLLKLKNKEVIYRCFLTRQALKAELEASGQAVYRGPKQALSEDEIQALIEQGQPYAWRLSMERVRELLGDKFSRLSYQSLTPKAGQNWLRAQDLDQITPQTQAINAWNYGDEIIARKDIKNSYHLAVTHDDHAQNITHIIRGQDLSETTGFHVVLQTLMGWDSPSYYHHPLLHRNDGQKLSKRTADTSIRALLAQGLSADDIFTLALQHISG